MQQSRSEVTERDGLVELSAGSDVLDSPRYNHWWCGTPAIALAR